MPKITLSNFEGGISHSDKLGGEGQYAWAENLDVKKNKGYLGGGLSPVELTNAAANVDDLIVDITEPRYDSSLREVFAIDRNDTDGNCKLYYINADTHTLIVSGSFPRTIEISTGTGVVNYYANVSGTPEVCLFYILKTNVGRMVAGPTFDDDFMSTVPANAASLSGWHHPYIIWDNTLWIGDGRYVFKYDGLTGDDGTVKAAAFDVGSGYTIMDIAATPFYLVLFVSRVFWSVQNEIVSPNIDRSTFSEAILWDSSSVLASKRIPLGNGVITSAKNIDGTIYFFAAGSDGKPSLRSLTDNGFNVERKLDFEAGSFRTPRLHATEIHNNEILFALERTGGSYLASYGRNEITGNKILTIPFKNPFDGTAGRVGAIKSIGNGEFYVATSFGVSTSVFKLEGYTSNAENFIYRGIFPNFERRVRTNYVKVYFKKLASGDSATVYLITDYTYGDPGSDTLFTVGTASYTLDGAIIEKKFKFIEKCQTFRPYIVASANVRIAKIVIDYDYISDL